MAILGWLIFGLVVGLIARAIMPGRQSMGFVGTALLGIAGSLLGGFVASSLSGDPMNRLAGSGALGSVIGAIVLLALGAMLSRGSTTPAG